MLILQTSRCASHYDAKILSRALGSGLMITIGDFLDNSGRSIIVRQLHINMKCGGSLLISAYL